MVNKYMEFEQDGVKYNLYDMPDGFVIKGDVDLSKKNLTELPDLSKVIVEGSFDCQCNELTSLKGAPQKVGGSFDCAGNKITSLRGIPQKIKGDFNCSYNKLTSLKGAPQKVGGSFRCNDNQLTTLKGGPQEVGGGFDCSYNQLTSLKGGPQEVGGSFNCSANKLTSLIGGPQKVGENFSCNDNQLTSLEGAPQVVKDNFYCRQNENMKSLLYMPTLPEGGEIHCDNKLGKKYGFSNSEEDGFTYGELLESTVYKAEVSRHNIEAKKRQERAESAKKAGSWYREFKKGANSKDSGRE